MLIYISTLEKSNIIEEVCQANNILVLKGIVKKDFDFVLYSNLQNEFENVDYIIIEIDSLKTNTTEQILQGIKALQLFYNMKIIIICNMDIERNKKIVSTLINEYKIYNIITKSETEEIKNELNKCIKEKVEYKDISFLNIQDQVNIGIIGVKSGIGTTTQSIAIVKYINKKTNSVQACYIERVENKIIDSLEKYYNIKAKNQSITFQNVDMYKNKPRGYKYNLFDFGTIHKLDNIKEFLKCDIKIIICGSKTWQIENLFETFEIIEKNNNGEIFFIFNSTPKEQEKEIKRAMGKYKKTTYFSEEIKNPFSENIDNENIYKEIFNNIEVKEEKETKSSKRLKWRKNSGSI